MAPILAFEGREGARDRLPQGCGAALADAEGADLTPERMAHRSTGGSKKVLVGWHHGSAPERGPANRTPPPTAFGSASLLCPRAIVAKLRRNLKAPVARHLPRARLLDRS